jgi:hypothetical protein
VNSRSVVLAGGEIFGWTDAREGKTRDRSFPRALVGDRVGERTLEGEMTSPARSRSFALAFSFTRL